MEVNALYVEIFPDVRPNYQQLHICCRVNGKDFHTEEYFPKDDLHATFDRMFESAKWRIMQVLETKYNEGRNDEKT